jgi:hypothetical protein
MKKRRWFRRDTDAVESDPQDRVDEVLRTYRIEIADRLEEGLREIQDRTIALIKDIATEVWSPKDADTDLQERVLSVLSRDAALRGLIAHSDERFQSLDLRMQSVTDLAEDLRRLLERGAGTSGAGSTAPEPAVAGILQQRMATLQRYLASVLEYEAERDRTIAEWLQKLFEKGRVSLREEAGWVIDEIGADVDSVTGSAAERILGRMDEQTRSLTYDLAAQEARIRLSVTEGRENQTALLREQLRVLESIESDLTTELDDRLSRLAELTGDATSRALDSVADRVGDRSAQAVTVGMKDLLALIDRRFAWLEETVHDRLSALERAFGVESEPRTTMLPPSEDVVSIDDALESARAGSSERDR